MTSPEGKAKIYAYTEWKAEELRIAAYKGYATGYRAAVEDAAKVADNLREGMHPTEPVKTLKVVAVLIRDLVVPREPITKTTCLDSQSQDRMM